MKQSLPVIQLISDDQAGMHRISLSNALNVGIILLDYLHHTILSVLDKDLSMFRDAVGYVRVSSERQVSDGISLEAQRQKIAAYCALADMRLAECYTDEGISGRRTSNRPGLRAALDRACAAKAVLITYSLSRLARSTRDCLDVAARLRDSGADLVLLDLRVDTTHYMGRFVFTLMAAMAELESDQISERVKGCLAFARGKGLTCGRPPYGYDVVDGRLVVNENEQLHIGYMSELRAVGWSWHRIAEHMNRRGVRGKRGGRWCVRTVRYLLSERYSYTLSGNAENHRKVKIA